MSVFGLVNRSLNRSTSSSSPVGGSVSTDPWTDPTGFNLGSTGRTTDARRFTQTYPLFIPFDSLVAPEMICLMSACHILLHNLALIFGEDPWSHAYLDEFIYISLPWVLTQALNFICILSSLWTHLLFVGILLVLGVLGWHGMHYA
jgi:hypothetical protein